MAVRQSSSSQGVQPSRWAARVVLSVLACSSALLVAGCGGAATNPETFNIGSGKKVTRNVKFDAGTKVQIWVDSEQDSDIDLFVRDEKGKVVVGDERLDKNCQVTFTPGRKGDEKGGRKGRI